MASIRRFTASLTAFRARVDVTLRDDVATVKNLVRHPISALDTAPERAQVKDAFVNLGGAAIGVAGMYGLRYPVKSYREQVSPGLWRGSRVDAAGAADLKKLGVRSLVELTKEANTDAALAQQNGMGSLHLGILDNRPPTNDQVKQFLDYVTQPEHQPAYVHCEAGVGRTGVMVAAYRMAVEGWTPEAALAEANQHGLPMPDQRAYILQLGEDLAAGKIAGYPLT